LNLELVQISDGCEKYRVVRLSVTQGGEEADPGLSLLWRVPVYWPRKHAEYAEGGGAAGLRSVLRRCMFNGVRLD